MRLFDVDSVISVYEDLANHYQHVDSGLRPLFPRRPLRLEKEALWVENGAIYLSKVDNLKEDDVLGRKIGHIVMLKNESVQIDSEEEFLLAECLLQLERAERGGGHRD
jgi:CMP-N-acetylneuraminic acid synthetase